MNRDDMMTTGFIPADFTSPITVEIVKIEGEELLPVSGICPPSDWDGSRRLESWTPADPQPDLFITITTMMELEEDLAMDVTHHASEAAMHGPSCALTILIALCLRRFW